MSLKISVSRYTLLPTCAGNSGHKSGRCRANRRDPAGIEPTAGASRKWSRRTLLHVENHASRGCRLRGDIPGYKIARVRHLRPVSAAETRDPNHRSQNRGAGATGESNRTNPTERERRSAYPAMLKSR